MEKPFECISDFIFINSELSQADIIIVLGGNKAEKLISSAAQLYKNKYASKILITGGKSHNNDDYLGDWKSECDYLSDIAISEGVAIEDIIKEDKAQHSFDNANLSWNIISKLQVKKILLVCKSYHARRSLMTFQTVYPQHIDFLICPVEDDSKILINNWYLEITKIEKVMNEVEKIGKYFGKHIPKWRE